MGTAEIAWAAGLFEGEGTVRYNYGSNCPMLSMGSTDKDVLDRLAIVIGQGAKTPAHYKPMWHWQLAGLVEVATVLRAFWPHLGERRRAKAADTIAEYYLDDKRRIPGRRNKLALAVKDI